MGAKPIQEQETRNPHFLKHGLSHTRIYKIWRNMRSRCENPNATKYHLYGGKGIKVCEVWAQDFTEFYEWSMRNGYQEHLTIDRIDGNDDYKPSNCRWVDFKTQSNNTSSTRYLTYNGLTLPLSQWADKVGLKHKTLSERIRRGWSVERALTTPKIDIKNFGNYVKEWKEKNDI